MYNDLIGGVLALTKDQFIKANGWSNLYWGWGVSLLLELFVVHIELLFLRQIH